MNKYIFFDENFPKPIVDLLRKCLEFHHNKTEVIHLLEKMQAGSTDDDVIKSLVDIKSKLIVMSFDRGKTNRGPKFPLVCKEFKITHVLFSSSLANSKIFEKLRAIISKWPEIEKINSHEGKCYKLKYINKGSVKYFTLSAENS